MAEWYTDDFKYRVFLLWYNNGKPNAKKLRQLIPEDWKSPATHTLGQWISGDMFQDQATELDSQVSIELESRLVKEKVEMLSRHAALGERMQNIAMEYIDNNEDNLTSNAAVRLLIEGVRIERESKGVPQAVEKMMNKSDEELVEEVKKLMKESSVEILED